MNKFNLESAKFVSIIIGICFIFIMVVWHAFDYIPAKDSINNSVDEIVVPADEEPQEERVEEEEPVEENAEEDQFIEETSTNELDIKKEVYDKEVVETRDARLKPLDPIDEENLKKDEQLKDSISSQEDVREEISPLELALNKAKDAKDNRQFTVAVTEYQKAISLSEDDRLKAQCYEEIAIIYAKSKRYGSALSYAQKAYNMVPSTAREVLLARLYFKTGDVDKATTRVNNVLNRDF